jgi:hypothetical protein
VLKHEAIDTFSEAEMNLQELITLASDGDVSQLSHSCHFIPGETLPDREIDGDENRSGLESEKSLPVPRMKCLSPSQSTKKKYVNLETSYPQHTVLQTQRRQCTVELIVAQP